MGIGLLIIGLTVLCIGIVLQFTSGSNSGAESLTWVGAGDVIGSIILLIIILAMARRENKT